VVARWAHNPKVAGSSPALATKTIKRLYYYIVNRFFIFNLAPDYENPQDIDRDNIYRITITVADGDGNCCSANGVLSTTKTFAIKVIKDTSN
tara:strand:- start:361 stop:636 length:276 start_codon:yes stop_codon:yes gene_type:complete